MQNKVFPKFDTHAAAHCFHCGQSIGHEKPLFYGFPAGAYGIWCDTCKLRTYYDTPDKSVKFDAKGDPLAQTCPCGCTAPRDQWAAEYSYPQCPDCGMV